VPGCEPVILPVRILSLEIVHKLAMRSPIMVSVMLPDDFCQGVPGLLQKPGISGPKKR
jgi:hypothetical protein